MDKKQGLEYLYSSRLAPYFRKDNITDVSYNGVDVFYVDNNAGRNKSDIRLSEEEARDFLRQIANICEMQFSTTTPFLNLTIGNFRINAVHHSIGRVKDEQAVTFSIRIASSKIRIYEDLDFLTPEIKELFDILMASHQSIVIGGLPGTGKTELQKYLLTRLAKDQRVIVVDNVLELETLRDYVDYDLTTWQYNERNQNATLSIIIKEALRNMPDWLILAEGRGKEMLDILNSAVTGLPIITTLHSFDVNSIPVRMARLVMLNEENSRYENILNDIYYHFRFYVYLNWRIDDSGNVLRYVSEVAFFSEAGKKKTIYRFKNDKKETFKMTPTILERLDYQNDKDFIRFYVEGDK